MMFAAEVYIKTMLIPSILTVLQYFQVVLCHAHIDWQYWMWLVLLLVITISWSQHFPPPFQDRLNCPHHISVSEASSAVFVHSASLSSLFLSSLFCFFTSLLPLSLLSVPSFIIIFWSASDYWTLLRVFLRE